MAKIHSKDSYIAIDNTSGSPQVITPNVTSVDGLPGERELVEITALGDAARAYFPGLTNSTITIEGYWDDTSNTGTDTVLGPLYNHTAALSMQCGPEGGDSGDIKYSLECFCRSYTITSRMGEIVTFRAEFQSNGAVTRGTF